VSGTLFVWLYNVGLVVCRGCIGDVQVSGMLFVCRYRLAVCGSMRDDGTTPDNYEDTHEGEHSTHLIISGNTVIVVWKSSQKCSRLILHCRRSRLTPDAERVCCRGALCYCKLL
jgi:hypothetical protein